MKKLFLAVSLILLVFSTPATAQRLTSGYVTNIIVENLEGKLQTYVPLTFGQVFIQGDVPQGYGITLGIGTTVLPSQLDVKALHPDGSVRHGIISAIIPSLPVGNTEIKIYIIKLQDFSTGLRM